MYLFIIPGNPPALYFYQLWAEEIRREHPESSIYISSYPEPPASKKSSTYLKDVAAFHGKELQSFHETIGKKVTVIGHSLGAWMTLHLLEEYDTIIEKGLLLYPFLQRPSIKGRMVLKAMRWFYQMPFIEDMLLSCRGVLEKFFVHLRYVSDEELRVSLALGYHEDKVISRQRENLQIPKQWNNKLHMVYCDQDKWCPSRTIDLMKQWVSCEKTDATHSFITSKEERAIVLQIVLQQVIKR